MSLQLVTPWTGSLCVFTFCLLGSIILSWNSIFFQKENESLQGLQSSTRVGGLACPPLLPIQPPTMTHTILLLDEIPTATPEYLIHNSTLNDIIAIKGKIYPRNPYASNGTLWSEVEIAYLPAFLWCLTNDMAIELHWLGSLTLQTDIGAIQLLCIL